MAPPTIFVSSTCYDLAHIRENLKHFISLLGYVPVLSEDGAVYYDPYKHVEDACLTEIENAHMLVLIIGGRTGASFHDTDKSITNAEYENATRLKIPIFALVSASVLSEYYLHRANRDTARVDPDVIVYPSVDNVRIFDFIEKVRNATVNNALVPFSSYADIETYLRMQWASMMRSFLARQAEESRVADTLSVLTEINQRVEVLSEQILKSVGSSEARLTVRLYDLMVVSEAVHWLSYMGARPTPIAILQNSSYEECAKSLGIPFVVQENRREFSISPGGAVSKGHAETAGANYLQLRQDMFAAIEDAGQDVQNFIDQNAQNLAVGSSAIHQPKHSVGRKTRSPAAADTSQGDGAKRKQSEH